MKVGFFFYVSASCYNFCMKSPESLDPLHNPREPREEGGEMPAPDRVPEFDETKINLDGLRSAIRAALEVEVEHAGEGGVDAPQPSKEEQAQEGRKTKNL